MADHMRTELGVDALEMALQRRRPAAGLVHHSDQGSAPARPPVMPHRDLDGLPRRRLRLSPRAFFATLKRELVSRHSWPITREFGAAVFGYIEKFYNRDQRHSMLGMLSPAQYEQPLYAEQNHEVPREEIKPRSVV